MHLARTRHLPVLDNDGEQLVGIATQRDLFRGALAQALGYGEWAQRKMLDTLVVKAVITTDLITTTLDPSLVEAAKVLMERKIGGLPVLEDGRLAGIITESDFVGLRS
jgi:acetoin utilization protein AcuB